MYVRWQTRRRTTRGEATAHWAAVLVENVRVKGRPTQRHVAYLGGITEADATEDAGRRIQFWEKATELLDALKNMPAEERRRVESTLAARVPRPTARQQQRHARQQAPPRRGDPQRIAGLELELEELELELEEERERL
jgi:hypothetical protein